MQPQYTQYPQQPPQPQQQLPQPQPQSPYSPPPIPESTGGARKALIIVGIVLIGLVVLAGTFAAGIYTASKLAVRDQTATQQSTPASTSANKSTMPHFVVSVGTPVQPKNPVSYTTKIGVPASLQAVRVNSTTQDTGSGFALFGNGTFNNELARFAFGNPSNASDNSESSQLSLIAITKDWLAATGETDFSQTTAGFPAGIVANALKTPADKKAFMSDLPSSVATCAKDDTKGFKTDDGTLSACYVTTYGREGYAPVVTFVGYSNVNSQPAVLYGSIAIFDNSVAGNADAQQAAIQAAKEGKPTDMTATTEANLLSALKQSGIVITRN